MKSKIEGTAGTWLWRGLHLALAGINVFMRIITFDLANIISWEALVF